MMHCEGNAVKSTILKIKIVLSHYVNMQNCLRVSVVCSFDMNHSPRREEFLTEKGYVEDRHVSGQVVKLIKSLLMEGECHD